MDGLENGQPNAYQLKCITQIDVIALWIQAALINIYALRAHIGYKYDIPARLYFASSGLQKTSSSLAL